MHRHRQLFDRIVAVENLIAAGPAVASLLGPAAQHVPHLTLAGIALAQPAVA